MINESGLMTVVDEKGANLFSSDYQYIKTQKDQDNPKYNSILQDRNLMSLAMLTAIFLNKSERIIEFYARVNDKKEKQPHYSYLYYENDVGISEIANYHSETGINVEWFAMSFRHKSGLLWDMLPDNKLVFTHPGHAFIHEENLARYVLHFLSLEEFVDTKIYQKYTKVSFPDSLKERYLSIFDDYGGQRNDVMKIVETFMKNEMEKTKFHEPVQKLLTDKNIVFVFTYTQSENGEIYTDVFNADSGIYIRSAFFKVIPLVIKNGYAYRLKKGNDIFPVVEKYRIDPAVYHK